ncbi:hypothetical protein ACOMHN_056408 [Nucella lapillus]
MRHLMWAVTLVTLVTLELTTGQDFLWPGQTLRPGSEKCNAPETELFCRSLFPILSFRYNPRSGECEEHHGYCNMDAPDFASKEKCIAACVP